MPEQPDHYDAIILGAGGAGMMCAAMAGQRGRRVLLIDHADKPGKKILISGGGRCNFTNIQTAPDRYLSGNPHFAKSALSRYTAQDFIALVDSHGIAWHEKTLGQLFCDGPACQIVDMLLAECEKGRTHILLGDAVGDVSHDGSHYKVALRDKIYTAPKLVVATGGPSIPKMGATGFAYDLARQFGLKIVEPRPALVPLTLGGDEVMFRELSGVSANVVATCGKTRFREAALFTHRGLSGPAILQVSSYWRHGDMLKISFLPDHEPGWLKNAKKDRHSATLASLLSSHLPARLAAALAEKLDLPGTLANLPDRKLAMAEEQLASWAFHPNGSEGFAKAEVTAGGVSTAELSSKTMEARKMPGLYVIGEAADVTGWLGGYNFQWAWASGWAAAQDI
ncbi:NAD(P)/FAD-dependent oxidoreductase [Sphingorhabdus sp. Alg239-R122]|uniref:NAD(P)/FAD-dependent oxidoreductase n=1 Tax=Sphingorhabdus sp. Alg239-R122 TaxID=2305989 RepID=UPI0013D9745D|nr:NAD(P)/FAD-dependent oxidoreductase [Sphingorhabdus sp. Alg239-R122]